MKPSTKTLAFLVTALLTLATGAGRLAAQQTPAVSSNDLIITEAAELLVGLDVSPSTIRDIDIEKIDLECREYEEGTACIATYKTKSEETCRGVAGLVVAAQAAGHHARGDHRPFIVRVNCRRHQVDALWTHGVVGVVDRNRETEATTYSTVVDRRTSPFAA